ncbi:MAG: hypothetical protein WA632_05285, partial [Gallionella sp.]
LKLSGAQQHQIVAKPGGPHLMLSTPANFHVNDMVTYQGSGLLATDERGLLIADVAPTGRIAVSTGYETQGKVNRVIVENSYGWLLSNGTDVIRLDLNDLVLPEKLAEYRSTQPIKDIAAQGNYAYLLLDDNEIAIIEMAASAEPKVVSRFQLEEPSNRIFVRGDHIYVTQPGYGLEILDAGYKPLLRRNGRYAVSGGATDVVVRDDVALVASGKNGIVLFDVVDPDHARWLGSYSRMGHVEGFSTYAKKTLLWNDQSELISPDMSYPELPSIDKIYRNNKNPSRWLHAMWLNNTTVLAASDSALESIDFLATAPQYSNENLDTGQGVNFGGERRVFIENNIAYVADWFSGLHLYDISTPTRPRLLSSFHTPGSAKGVVVRDGYAYIADDDHGLQVVDVHDPLLPAHVSNLDTKGLAYTPKLSGNRLYLAGHRGGVQIIDVSNVADPKLVASIDTPGKAWSVEIVGDILFVADDTAGVLVYNVSDAANPRQIAVFNPGGAAEDVVVRGETAYAAFFEGGFYVLDAGIPEQMQQIGYVATPGNARGIALSGDHAYVADWFAGVQVIDISNPATPNIMGSYDTSGAAWGVAIRGKHAYVGDWWGGFAVLDVSVPAKPALVDRYQFRGKVARIAAAGKFAYAAMDSNGVQVFDITNPLNPTWMTGVEIDGTVNDICLDSGLLFVAVGNGKDSGLVTIDVSNPFQARRIAQFSVQGGVERVRSADGKLYFSNEFQLGVIDPIYPEKTRLWFTHVAKIYDLWVNAGQVFIASGLGMEVLDERLDLVANYPTPEPPSLIRARGDTVMLYGESLGIQVLQVSGKNVDEIAIFVPGEKLTDLAWDDTTLFATGPAGKILQMDVSDYDNISLKGIYSLSRAATAIKIMNGNALLAGNDIITSVKLPPSIKIEKRSAKEIHLQLSADMPAGDYDLVDIAPDGKRSVSYSALSIDAPAFEKPDITTEEFLKLLKVQRNLPASNAEAPQR